MAKYSECASKDVARALHKRKQAIAIGLSEARAKGKQVLNPKKASRRSI